jgi:hypothetical protein
LVEWLAAFSALLPEARRISRKRLLEQNGDDLPPWATCDRDGKWTYGTGYADQAWTILDAIAGASRFSDGWREHAAWVRAFDYKDSDQYETLPAMMGLTFDDLHGGGWNMGPDGAGDILARCNQLAIERAIDQRFFSLRTGGDNLVVVMLRPSVAGAMVAERLLELDLSPPPQSARSPRPRSPAGVALRAGLLERHGDLLLVFVVALLSIPTHIAFHDRMLTIVPIVTAVLMLRGPIARRVPWLRWLQRRE